MGLLESMGVPWYSVLIFGLVFWGVLGFLVLYYFKEVKRFIEELLDWENHKKQRQRRRVSINTTVETNTIRDMTPETVAEVEEELGEWSQRWTSQSRHSSTFTMNIISQIFGRKDETSEKHAKLSDYLDGLETSSEPFTETDVEMKEIVVVPTMLTAHIKQTDLSRGYYVGKCEPDGTMLKSTPASSTAETVFPEEFAGDNLRSADSSVSGGQVVTSVVLSLRGSQGFQSVCRTIDEALVQSLDQSQLKRDIIRSYSQQTQRTERNSLSVSVASVEQAPNRIETDQLPVIISPASEYPAMSPLNLTFITQDGNNGNNTHSAASSARSSLSSSTAQQSVRSPNTVQQQELLRFVHTRSGGSGSAGEGAQRTRSFTPARRLSPEKQHAFRSTLGTPKRQLHRNNDWSGNVSHMIAGGVSGAASTTELSTTASLASPPVHSPSAHHYSYNDVLNPRLEQQSLRSPAGRVDRDAYRSLSISSPVGGRNGGKVEAKVGGGGGSSDVYRRYFGNCSQL